ncbi:hypothetical protein O971_12410 [Mycobacterium avium subsp. hominissuis 10-4249]|nr:hypothetical protein O971_12410 [Mycobacterium avium subsp. hominissuis 10-4249]KDO96340.1 hypothetical protein MAVA5_11585 [Mycobacterium avium subsp. hominissuis A5]
MSWDLPFIGRSISNDQPLNRTGVQIMHAD